jgi:hypothetical protein
LAQLKVMSAIEHCRIAAFGRTCRGLRLDEVMYYVWYRDGVVVEAGLRLKRKNDEIPRWLYLAKRNTLEHLFDFGETDKKFIAGLLRDAEPHVKAGCRVPKPQRLEYAKKLKINLPITQSEAVPDPDFE